MGTGDRISVRGAAELKSSMAALADDLTDLESPGRAAGAVIVAAAQGFAPRRTGALRASIIVDNVGTTGVVVSAGSGISRPYPAVQEFGSRRRHIVAHRYMRQAADRKERAVVTEYETAIDRAVDKVKGA